MSRGRACPPRAIPHLADRSGSLPGGHRPERVGAAGSTPMASMALPGFPFERRCQLRAPSLLDQTDPATTAYRRSGLPESASSASTRSASSARPTFVQDSPSRRSGRARLGPPSRRILAPRQLPAHVPGRRPRALGPAASGSRRRGRGSKSPPRVRVDRQRRMPRRMPGPSGSPAPRRPSRARRFASATTRCQSRAKGDSDRAG